MSDNEMSDKEKAGAEVGAAQTTKDIFGSDSEDSDSEEAPPLPSKPLSPKAETSTKPSGSSNDMKDIFGDDSDSDNESDKGDDVKQENSDATMKVSDANDMDFLNDGETSQFKELKHAATHSKICISNTEKLQEDAATFSVKLPNFLKIQTKPYTKKLHHEEAESTLFPGATSMIRWRYKQNQNGDVEMDEKGQPVRESNARLVKWSDGSYQLIVGLEVFDSSTFPVSDSYLYAQRKSAVPQPSDPTYESISEEERDEIKTDTSLECVGAAAERIVLRPSSVVSAAHARLSLAIAEKYSRKTKIKDREYGNVIINAEKDTDARAAAINEEIRRAERRRRAQMDSSSSAPSRFAPSMSSRFMEEDDRYDNTSLNAIKKRGKAGNGRLPSHSSDEEEEDDEPDEEDNDFIVNDGDEDEEDGDWGGRSDGSDDNNKRSAPKKDKTSKKSKKSILKDDTDSDQDDFETVKPKKRSQESEGADGNADDGEATSQKKRRRAIVDSSDDED